MFKINPKPTFRAAVKLSVPGSDKPAAIAVDFKHLGKTALRDYFAGLEGKSDAEALADIARIEAIWAEALAAHGGPFLFGRDFGAADAMFAPVVTRFLTWQPDLSATSRAYVAAVRAHPLMERWHAEAAAEPAAWLIERYENPPA